PPTPREREVLGLLARGLTDKEAARQLGVSPLTARKHRENLLRKTRTHKVAALVALAVRQGWLSG
ncbi:LuxR C-terminal-related transcriptional regulator, partial [Nostoc sp. NIES-2111]